MMIARASLRAVRSPAIGRRARHRRLGVNGSLGCQSVPCRVAVTAGSQSDSEPEYARHGPSQANPLAARPGLRRLSSLGAKVPGGHRTRGS